MGKSSSALNKALCRFGIRLPKSKTKYIVWSPDDPYCQNKASSLISFKKKKENCSTQNSYNLKRTKQQDKSIYVHLSEVIHYLQIKDCSLNPLIEPLIPEPFFEAKFLLGNKPLTPLQLLLIANKFRIAEKQPIFLVEDITW